MMNNSVEALPEDLLVGVFSWLDVSSLGTCFQVCVSWEELLHGKKTDEAVWSLHAKSWFWLVKQKPATLTWLDLLREILIGNFAVLRIGGTDPLFATSLRTNPHAVTMTNRREWRRHKSTIVAALDDETSLGNSLSLLYDIPPGDNEDRLFILPELQTCRTAMAVTASYDPPSIFVAGGTDGSKILSSVERYDAATGRWSFSPALSIPRCFASAVIDRSGLLCVIGGGAGPFRGAASYGLVEALKPTGWISCPSMRKGRAGHLSAVDAKGYIYSVGGYGGGDTYRRSIESWDSTSGAGDWQMHKKKMTHRRTGAGGGFGPDNCLYVCGGSCDGSDYLATMERYDPRAGSWQELASMNVPRSYYSAAFGSDGLLYACGGSEIDLFFSEAYDPRSNIWIPLGDVENGNDFGLVSLMSKVFPCIESYPHTTSHQPSTNPE